jgi:competence protein ComEC
MRSPWPSLAVVVAIAILVAIALPRSDEIRARAADGLARGMPARETELARGFVLGADDGIDARTEEDFRRAGLSHLLAVSGQNVTLLALLALPVLATLRIPLRERLLWVLALIAVYVPLAGAGPSIQRAGVMGAAGLLATMSGRRASRLYALALALVVTLAVDPTIAAEVGWQLSFAAVAGIFVLAAPIRSAIVARCGDGGLRRALADGAAVTIAASLATAPLITFHFEALSTVSLAANLLALPAVAPAMWLGMASAAAAQVPGFPVEALNAPNALLLAYIAQVAAWCAAPEWAEVEAHLNGMGLACAYALLALGIATVAFLRRLVPRRRLRALLSTPGLHKRPVFALAALGAIVLGAMVAAPAGAPPGRPPGLRVTVLDVGQGDAILLQPAAAPALLVDAGPSSAGLLAELDEAGVERLGAVVVTHDQSDHAGGVEELLGGLPVERLAYARLGRDRIEAARAAGVAPLRLAAGQVLRSGGLRLDVLWPPLELLAEPFPGADPNQLALVLLARWRHFTMLLAADAEAEAVPLDPGPIDILKVAHHGSADAGLAALLERTRPRLAAISVGADNPYGHPAVGTLAALASHGVPTLRTDLDGEIEIAVERGSIEVRAKD